MGIRAVYFLCREGRKEAANRISYVIARSYCTTENWKRKKYRSQLRAEKFVEEVKKDQLYLE